MIKLSIMKKLFSLILVSILVAVSASAAIRTAVTGTWTLAATNTAFPGVITTTADSIIIPSGVTVTISATGVTCGALIVNAGGTLTYQSSSSRSVTVVSGAGYFGTVTIDGTVAAANSNAQFIAWNGPSFTLGASSNWTWAGTSSGADGGIHYTGTGITTIFGNNKIAGALQVSSGGTVNLLGNVTFRGQGTAGFAVALLTATSQLKVPASTTLTVDKNPAAASTGPYSIVSGSKILVDGTIEDKAGGATGVIAGAGAITMNSGTNYIFNSNGTTLIATAANGAANVSWGAGSICEVKGITTTTSFVAGNQSFQNFIWNCSGQTSGVNFTGTLSSVAGYLDIQNTNNQNLRLTGAAALTLNITGDLKVSGLNGISKLDICNGAGAPTVNVNGNVSIGGNGFAATLLSANTSTVKVKGNWTNGANGAFTPANTTVEFNSTTANQTITRTGGETFNTLVINNTFGGTGVTLANNATAATLTLTAGKVATGANLMTVTGTAGLVTGGTTNYVNGTLVRNVAASATTVAFPVGDISNYTPLSLNFGGTNTAGNVTVSTSVPNAPATLGAPPTGSGLSQTQFINRNWTVASAITATYAATFTYINPGDVTGGANTSALLAALNNGVAPWSNPSIASSFSPTVATNSVITTFGTFSLGEAGACTSNTFSGTGDWTDNARWSCGLPPNSGDNVTIAAGANATLNTDFTVAGSLLMTATSTLTVNPTRTLTVSGTANFAGQAVTFLSDATGTASLGQVSGTLSGATNVTVERFIPNNGFRSWRLLSVPTTTSQTIRQAWQEGDANPLPKDNNLANRGTQITGVFTTQAAAAAAGFDSTSVNAGLLRWNGASWTNVVTTNQPINNFSSWFLYIRGDRALTVTGSINSSSFTTLRTKGTVYTGDQTTNIGASAFALVPNLYPSAINFTGLTRTGGVNNLFYIWDSKKLNGVSLGVYQTFSATNSFNCLIAGGSYTVGVPNTTIESGQSFFVTSGAAGTIVLKETAKISGTNGSLGFRPSGIKSKIDTKLYNSNDEMLDANTVVFDAAYSKAVSEEDAPKLGNPGANFAIETESKLLAIEGTSLVKENDAIQFRMWNLATGSYKLEFALSNLSLPAGTNAILEDSYLKTSTVVNANTGTVVNFTTDQNAASKSANRFRIVFSKAKAVTAGTKQGYSIAPNPVENGSMNLMFKSQAAGKYSVRIIAAGGQSVSKTTITHAGGNVNQSIVLPATMGSGTYTVEITAPDKSRSTQTLLVNRK
jgi:hypothetical protein